MKEKEVKKGSANDNKGEQEMKGKESCEGCIINRKPSPDSLNEHFPSIRHGREKVGNYGRPPK